MQSEAEEYAALLQTLLRQPGAGPGSDGDSDIGTDPGGDLPGPDTLEVLPQYSLNLMDIVEPGGLGGERKRAAARPAPAAGPRPQMKQDLGSTILFPEVLSVFAFPGVTAIDSVYNVQIISIGMAICLNSNILLHTGSHLKRALN